MNPIRENPALQVEDEGRRLAEAKGAAAIHQVSLRTNIHDEGSDANDTEDGLTESELRVARLAARGLTNRQIGEQLFLSPHTVSSHLRHTFTKLEISSRVELARMATQHDPTRA